MTTLAHPVPTRLVSRDFVKAYITTMRPYLLFVSGITGAAGLALAPSIPLGNLLLLVGAFFLSYGFGQALTDCFQLDTDALSAPYRPLVQGRIRREHVLMVSLVGLIAIGLVVVWHHVLNLVLSAVAVMGLATYTYFKRRWWAGPFYNAWIVSVVLLIGYLSGIGAGGGSLVWSPAIAGALLVAFFGYANFVLTGYFKDISADRATGYRTLPVVFGLRASRYVSDAFAVLTLAFYLAFAVTVVAERGFIHTGPALCFAFAGTVAAATAQVRLHRVSGEFTAHYAIVPVVHAYLLLLSAVAAAAQPLWVPTLALFYLAFVITMRRRPIQQQI